ncbi:MAG: hypothetical protein JNJ60_18545 [Rhodocyclaceae bacterium]|nr:hypothetical protein [Rhodocyclaceae bacterium]
MMQTPSQRMSAALKTELIPALKAMGFAGTFPRYRRERPASIQLLAIFYDKAGICFFLEFGAHERGDKLTSWGEVVPESKLLLEHVRYDQRARLQARCGGGSVAADWFAFEACTEDAQFRALAAEVAQRLPQVELWFESGNAGTNISPNGR